MKALVTFSIISLILLSGCTKQVETKEPSETTPTTAGQQSVQQSVVTEHATVEVTKASEEPSSTKTYQVNIVQGIGIREGSG